MWITDKLFLYELFVSTLCELNQYMHWCRYCCVFSAEHFRAVEGCQIASQLTTFQRVMTTMVMGK